MTSLQRTIFMSLLSACYFMDVATCWNFSIASVPWDAYSFHAMFLLHFVSGLYIYFDFEMGTKGKKKIWTWCWSLYSGIVKATKHEGSIIMHLLLLFGWWCKRSLTRFSPTVCRRMCMDVHVWVRQIGRPQRRYNIRGQESRSYMWGADPKKKARWLVSLFPIWSHCHAPSVHRGCWRREWETHVTGELHDV